MFCLESHSFLTLLSRTPLPAIVSGSCSGHFSINSITPFSGVNLPAKRNPFGGVALKDKVLDELLAVFKREGLCNMSKLEIFVEA